MDNNNIENTPNNTAVNNVDSEGKKIIGSLVFIILVVIIMAVVSHFMN